MRKNTYKIALRGFYLLLDSLCIVGSLLLAYLIYHAVDLGQGVVYTRHEITAFAGFLVLGGWGAMFLFGAYHRNSGILNVLEIRGVILGLLTLFAVINVSFFALRYAPSRYVIVMARYLEKTFCPASADTASSRRRARPRPATAGSCRPSWRRGGRDDAAILASRWSR